MDRKIERPTSTETNKMDDKNVYASFGFLNEISILNEIEKLERIYLATITLKEDTSMFSFSVMYANFLMTEISNNPKHSHLALIYHFGPNC